MRPRISKSPKALPSQSAKKSWKMSIFSLLNHQTSSAAGRKKKCFFCVCFSQLCRGKRENLQQGNIFLTSQQRRRQKKRCFVVFHSITCPSKEVVGCSPTRKGSPQSLIVTRRSPVPTLKRYFRIVEPLWNRNIWGNFVNFCVKPSKCPFGTV